MYQKPSERFLKDNVLKQAQAAEKKYFPERVKKVTDLEDDEALAAAAQTASTKATEIDDLLNMGSEPPTTMVAV